ncbi:MAG: DNA repair protein RadC [Rhodospirillales bacterium]|nr:DNA repair protein RadC [Rhodospirillales bacterium]
MPDATGFNEMPLYDVPAAPASVRQSASRRRLRSRFLRAGPEAVDDRELLELLLSGHGAIQDAGDLAGALLDAFGAAPRVLAARPDRLRTMPGLSEDAIAALKAAEALGIRMARAEVPETVRPSLGSYDKVIEYCRTLAGHREVEEFRILYLNRKNVLIADECLQKGSVCHTPVYPREVCIRALELQASAIVAVHPHPSGCPEPSRADIDMTKRMKDALKTIEVTLLDHIIVTPTGAVSFQQRGLI